MQYNNQEKYFITFNRCYLYSGYCLKKLNFTHLEYIKSFSDFEGIFDKKEDTFYFNNLKDAKRYIDEIIVPRIMIRKMIM